MIITDLDGSLLHPRTYSFDEAKPALEFAKDSGARGHEGVRRAFCLQGRSGRSIFADNSDRGPQMDPGKWFHILVSHHKGKAVNILRKLYEHAYGAVTMIGIGDSLNDLPLLLAVDKPVLIRRNDGMHDPRVTIPGLYRTEGPDPVGWNEAVMKELS